MKRRIAVVVLALVLAPVATCFAGIDNAGTTAANFLSVSPGASALGMGGATLGYANDLSSASFNVAALGKFDQTEALFAHAALSEASAQEWASVGGRFGKRTHWGMSGLYQGDASIAGRDAFGNPTGSFSTASTALGFSAARAVNSNVVVGAGFKWVNESLGLGVNGMGVGFDAGVLVQSGRFGFGAALQNVGGKVNYSGAKYPMPANYGMGVSVSDPSHGLRVALDLNFPDAYYSDARVGLEWRHLNWLALRTGYRKELGSQAGEPIGGPTFGMGAGANGFWFDYGYVVGASSGASEHRIGLTFKPALMNFGGGSVSNATPAPKPAEAPAKKKNTIEPAATASREVSEKPAKTTADDVAKAAPSTAQNTAQNAAPNSAPAAIVVPATDSAPRATTPGAKWYEKPAKKSGGDVAKAAPTTVVMPTLDSAPPREATPPDVKATAPKGAMAVGIPVTSIPIAPSAKPMAPVAPIPASVTPARAVASPATTTANPTATTATPASPVPANAKPATPSPTVASTARTAAPKLAAPPATTNTPTVTAAPTAPATAPVRTPTGAPMPAAPSPGAATPASPANAPATTPASVTGQPAASATPSAPAAVSEAPAPNTPAPTPKPAVATPATQTKPAVAVSEPKPQAPPAERPARAQVKKGQTLADFAKEWGTTPAAIMMENNLVSDRVKPGTTLKLPRK